VTDPQGAVFSYSYDMRGLRTAASDPDLGAWSFVYDLDGRLISRTDARGLERAARGWAFLIGSATVSVSNCACSGAVRKRGFFRKAERLPNSIVAASSRTIAVS
jgi:YD repeat-containing protein